MKTSFVGFVFSIIFLFSIPILYAVPAFPFPIQITQPDGTELTVLLHGDEFFNYKTSLDGYALIPDNKGVLTYAQSDSKGNLVSTSMKATNIENRTTIEKSFIRKLKTNFNFSKINTMNRVNRISLLSSNTSPQKVYPLNGTPRSIVILVNFSDLSYVTPNPKNAFTDLLNQKGYSANGGTGSAKDYFSDNSSRVFQPQFDVVGPYTLPNNMAFYGTNNASGQDQNPQQMVIDACTLAAANGVDFSLYDTDKNGIVDNVFIYFAGYNEAEGGPANSIWPHRWALNDLSTKFNGVSIDGYATTSELRGNSGANMCGVGTFCHEFGHVLGLPDLYNTVDQKNFTLSFWDIMDSGPYLNSGRTPCGYSSYERFFLNWLVPIELKNAADYNLDTLSTSNKAFIITQNGNHNLNGANPDPVEFFMLENRQNTGWDTYLYGHGMLVTHVYYNPTTWQDNTVNNVPSELGVSIIPADGVLLETKASLSGDPFPGTSHVTSIIPSLRSGTNLTKPLTAINELNGKIFFKFMGGNLTIVPPTATEATDLTFYSFIAHWNKVNDATGYYLTAYKISDGESNLFEGFDKGLIPSNDWTITAKSTSNSTAYSGINPPSIQFSNTNEFIETEKYMVPAIKLSFYIRSLQGNNGGFLIEAQNAQDNWEKVDSIPVMGTLFEKAKTYTFTESKGYSRFRFTYTKGIGSLTFDDVSVSFNKQLMYVEKDKMVTSTSDTISSLQPNSIYVFKVKTSDKNLVYNYENITDFSNAITTTTLDYPLQKKLLAIPDSNGNVKVFFSTPDGNLIVYNLLGQIIRIITPKSNPITITNLPRNQVYILKSNSRVAKIAI